MSVQDGQTLYSTYIEVKEESVGRLDRLSIRKSSKKKVPSKELEGKRILQISYIRIGYAFSVLAVQLIQGGRMC